MSDAPRDADQIPVRLGNDNGTPVPISIEHVTGFLNINYLTGTVNVPVFIPEDDVRDENQVTTLMGRTSTGEVVPVSIDHATGRLKVVLTP